MEGQSHQLGKMEKVYTIYYANENVKYYYVNYNYPGFVWRNAIVFAILHAFYCYGFYLSMAKVSWSCWLFSEYRDSRLISQLISLSNQATLNLQCIYTQFWADSELPPEHIAYGLIKVTKRHFR